jgi:hypothetical protein
MKHRVRLYSAALLVSAAPFLSVSCSKQEDSTAAAGGTGTAKSGTVIAGSVATAPASAWGFTAHLPKTTEGFVSLYRLGDLVTSFKSSGFVKKVLSIPEVAKEINMEKIQAIWDNNAPLKDAAALLESEVVFSMQEGFTDSALSLAKAVGPVMMAGIRQSIQNRQAGAGGPAGGMMDIMQSDPKAVAAMVQGLVETDLPPVMIALKAGSAKDRVDAMLKSGLEAMPPEAKQMLEPGTFKLAGKHEFQSLTFKAAKAIPPNAEDAVRAQLTQFVGDPAKAASLTGKLLAKTIEISWGWVDDSLVIGIGKDHSHVKLASPADGVLSLPETSARTGAWESKKPISLSYTSLKTNQAIVAALGGMMDTIISIVESGAGKAPFPMDGIIADLKKLSARANELWPSKVTASVAASWWDGGLNVESFGGPVLEAYDSSKPLSYGSLAGPATVLLSETRVNEASRDKAFAFVEEVVATLWSSFQTNVKPNLPPDAQQKLAMADVAIPVIKDLWTSIQVFRSALGSESGLLVNLDGAMPPLPQIPPELKNVKIPRILVVSDLKDRAKLGAAWLGISKVVNGIAALAQVPVKPDPVEKQEGNVTMWGLPIPIDTGDLWPHTAVAGNRWYLGTSPSFTKEAAGKTVAPSGPPAGTHVRLNFKAIWDYANSVSGVIPIQPEERKNMTLALELLSVFGEIDSRMGEDKGDSHITLFVGIKDLK